MSQTPARCSRQIARIGHAPLEADGDRDDAAVQTEVERAEQRSSAQQPERGQRPVERRMVAAEREEHLRRDPERDR